MAIKRRKKGRVKKGRRPPPLPGMPMPPPMPKKSKPVKKKRFKLKKKIKLSLKSSTISESSEGYNESAGWTSNLNTSVLDIKEDTPKQADFIKHQCGLCGTVMQVPKAKRASYTIICPHCEHEEQFG